MKVFGCVIVISRDGNGKEISRKEFYNEEIIEIPSRNRWLYGIDWVYGGDQGFKESSIYAEDGEDVFDNGYGRNGLKNFFVWGQIL